MKLRIATERHLKEFNPSQQDLDEAKAYGIQPAFPPASECVMIEHFGHAMAIGGNDGDQCWFVTSKFLKRITVQSRIQFRKLIIEHRDKLLQTYPVLWNFVWVGNTDHIRFLKTIGAVFHDEFSDESKQFQLFTIKRT
ncbi:internal virion protein A [Erwinia phage vB_EamP-L1]|uniref:Internal virion protein A n=2 Tax=Elunavirus TaxID=2732681 RepID=G0YQ79_9CAUD|nr:internal virion protein [Erwinia phage vB_EamP-L1]AEJ81506.1 internal virion protein A [Erwinia phage vB_EamP-L1]QFR42380.1 tail internal virion protein A [Pantoea phage vB_PagP-SK1]